jgi:glycosyltransferase involved in cell wall biosynthesis
VRLAIDASRLAGPRTGVGRHIEYLVDSWARTDLPFDEVRLYAHAPIDDLPRSPRFQFELLQADSAGVGWQLVQLRRRANDADVLFSAYTVPPGVRTRCVVLNPGILEGRFAVPGLRARLRSRHFAWSSRKADLVIAISETTKGDLVESYGVDPRRVRVERAGLARTFRTGRPADAEVSKAVERTLGLVAPYFLFVGKISARRHVSELVEAFRTVAGERPDLHLVLVGPNTGRIPPGDLAGDRLVHVPFLEAEELALLYRGAVGFVMPAEREGFPHTIAEAMASGCPVVVLRDAELGILDSMPRHELVLDADDPRPPSLAVALRRLLDDDALRTRLVEAGRRYADTFPSWDEHAARVMAILAEVAQRP